jgi:hypothetical protein
VLNVWVCLGFDFTGFINHWGSNFAGDTMIILWYVLEIHRIYNSTHSGEWLENRIIQWFLSGNSGV